MHRASERVEWWVLRLSVLADAMSAAVAHPAFRSTELRSIKWGEGQTVRHCVGDSVTDGVQNMDTTR